MTDNNVQLIKNKCCICNSEENSTDYKVVEKYLLKNCHRCKLVYLAEYPNTLHDFIEDSKENDKVEFWSFPNLYKKHQVAFDNFFQERLNRINKYKKISEVNTAFDIGIGYGFWAQYLIKNNIDAYGIDVSKEVIDYCKENKLSCDYQSFEKLEKISKYDLVCMFDVLEHFEDPKLMLEKTKKYLERDGILYIQVPNVLGIRIPYKHSLGLPYHLWQFNPKSLRLLLESSGYEVLEHWTGIQGVIGHYERGGPSFLNKTLWKVANKLKIGNRVQMIARVKNE